jgi:DNA repair photolyase
MRTVYVEQPCKSALNRVVGMPFEWSLNPYMGCAHRCAFCYVRGFERRADRPSDDRYGRTVRVKTNVADVLRFELARPSWDRSGVAIGAATDPYQPAEGRYRITRGCLVALRDHRNPFAIITRGPMIVRDIDVLQDAAARASVSVSLSVPTLDRAIWSATEPGTAPPHQRLRAVRMLVDAGIRASVALAPILPGLTDTRESIAEVVRAARDAGAASLWVRELYLKPGTKEHFLACLERHWPELLPRYERDFAARAYLPREYANDLREQVREIQAEVPRREPARAPIAPPPEPQQLDLAI